MPPYSLVGLCGDYYFLGSIAMNIAGVCEFVLGNSTSNVANTRKASSEAVFADLESDSFSVCRFHNLRDSLGLIGLRNGSFASINSRVDSVRWGARRGLEFFPRISQRHHVSLK